MSQLEGLGFSRADSEAALEAAEGRLEDAAFWLTQNATPVTEVKASAERGGGGDGGKAFISGFEVGVFCFCFIF